MAESIARDRRTHANCGGEIEETILSGRLETKVRCLKCGETNEQPMHQNTDWRVEFENEFGHYFGHKALIVERVEDYISSLLQAREEWLKGEIEKKLAKARDYYQETRLQPLEGEMSAFRDVLSLINKK